MPRFDDRAEIREFPIPRELQSRKARTGTSRLALAVLVAFAAILCFDLVKYFAFTTDYVGADNDDAMRLVEVRDFLAGQGWFDLMQYRLGPAPGTLMHWSRMIDLPIAALISLFGLFLPARSAEATALFIWPVALVAPFLYFVALSARRIGGEKSVYAAVVLASLFVFSVHKFTPGAIDHHNVQLLLMAMIVAALADPDHRPGGYVLAGFAGALALAVGAETTPLLAVAALLVAARWALLGDRYAKAAIAFGLSFGLFSAAAFFANIPPRAYTVVACDAMSVGYASLAAFGGLALAVCAAAARGRSLAVRLSVLGAVGIAAAVIAVTVMPQCLQNPLNSLDPLLRELWLDHVQEARSVLAQARTTPEDLGGFYIPGILAIVVCLWRIRAADRTGVHAVLLGLLVAAVAVSFVQVRGAMFSLMLSILPLSVLISELHAFSLRHRDSTAAGVPFAVMTLVSIPAFWFLIGALAAKGMDSKATAALANEIAGLKECRSETNLARLNALPAGMIAAPSNMGSPILRFTPHSVLAAPYHRDQAGLLAAFRAGLATPSEAEVILGNAGTRYFVYCPGDGEIADIARRAPNGFYASIKAGHIPPFLSEVKIGGDGRIRAFEMVR